MEQHDLPQWRGDERLVRGLSLERGRAQIGLDYTVS